MDRGALDATAVSEQARSSFGRCASAADTSYLHLSFDRRHIVGRLIS
jgi:hypothetical protein